MYTIDLQFRSISEIPLSELFDSIGVYVLWTPQAKKRPSYIGQGQILDRLVNHTKWLSPKIKGIIAQTNSTNVTKSKHDAEIAEALLLWSSYYVNKGAIKNQTWGNWSKLKKESEKHKTIRMNIYNYDPLKKPGSNGWRMDKRKVVSFKGFEIVDGLNYALFDPKLPWLISK